MRKPITIIFIFLIVVVLLFALVLKREPYKKWEGDTISFQPETFVAAESLLTKRLGEKKVKKLKYWAEFKPNEGDKQQLLILFQQDLKRQNSQDELLKWVEQGNHLVLAMEYKSLFVNPFDLSKDEEDEEQIEGLAPLPLSAALNFGYTTKEEDRSNQAHREASSEGSDDSEDGQSDDGEEKNDDYSSSLIREKWFKKLSQQPKQKTLNIDQQQPAPVCIFSLEKRLKAHEQESGKKEAITLAQLYDGKASIGELKKRLEMGEGKEVAPQSAPQTSAMRDEFAKQEMRASLVDCSEKMVKLDLTDQKQIDLLLDAGEQSIVYLGDKTPLLKGGNIHGSQIIRVPYGEGSITMLSPSVSKQFSDPTLPTYDTNSISQFDHAYFLAYLAQDKNKVLLLDRAEDVKNKPPTPSLIKSMYKHSPELLAVIVIFMILFAWSKIRREGQILAALNISRRNLREHFKAQGEFLRRHSSSSSSIIINLQNDIWYRAQKRLPNIRTLSAEDKKRELARLTRLKESEITILLMPVNERISTLELVRYIIALQKIRNNL